MTDATSSRPPRLLIIDDNPAIHDDFRKILATDTASQARLNQLESALFGGGTTSDSRSAFRLDFAFQGQDALVMAQKALRERDPYVLAFVDVRMPPGWDGIETLERLWECCSNLQAVLCTAYSDYSWDEMTKRLAHTDNLLILKKPFDTVEVLQLAHALTRKWELAAQASLRLEDLDRMVRERTRDLQTETEHRVRVEHALTVSEDRFTKAFQVNPMPMAIQSQADGRFLDVNASFLELAGRSAREVLGNTADQLRLWEKTPFEPPHDAPEARMHHQPAVLRRADGSSRQTRCWAEPITLNAGPCRLLIVQDITEHLRLEAQLRQSQKMEAIGCLAAGIAHEFNNLLTVIQGHAGLLRGKSHDPRIAAESVERIAQAGNRAASLTRRLLVFSRKQPIQLKPVNLGSALLGLQKMLSRLLGERYQIETDCSEGLPDTLADEGSIEQILINLLLNARDAMPDGGTIRVATYLAVLDDQAARNHFEARPGRFVCLRVADQGCGMTPEILNRIFDPFFTTKEVGRGTGLGLSTVHGLVQQHHGWIHVATSAGEGSTFTIFLPAHDGPRPAAAAEAPIPALAFGSGEAVLIVEDEQTVREMARFTLERSGYRVFEAADGPQALAVWEKSPVPITLLVTDMVLPNGISGGDLARTLGAKDPNLSIIYTSGYSSDVLSKDRALLHGVNFLPKPYDPLSLLQTVKRTLEAKPSAP